MPPLPGRLMSAKRSLDSRPSQLLPGLASRSTQVHPSHQVLGLDHASLPHQSAIPPLLLPDRLLTDTNGLRTGDLERERLYKTMRYLTKGSGYYHIQSTTVSLPCDRISCRDAEVEGQPGTVSYGLTDSPVGTLSWIGEKVHSGPIEVFSVC